MTTHQKPLGFFVKRLPIRLITALRIAILSFQNVFLRSRQSKSLQGGTGLIVSLTSYGHRVKWSFLAIESIIASGCRPNDVYLWLAHGTKIGKPLEKLVSRGLNIRYVEDYKSHKKYCFLDTIDPSFASLGFILADDDMVYPLSWYSTIRLAAESAPNRPCVMLGAQASLENGQRVTFEPTQPDKQIDHDLQGLLFHGFSGSGFFIPQKQMQDIDKNPKRFMEICPSNDDIWLHRELFRMGAPIYNLGGKDMPPSIPFVAGEGLFQINWHQGQNEVQLKKAFEGLIPLA
jgi:hypothetical protein